MAAILQEVTMNFFNNPGRRSDLLLMVVSVGFIVAGMYAIGARVGTAQTVPDPGNPNLTFEYAADDPSRVVRFHLPEPDDSTAVSANAGLTSIEHIPGVGNVLAAIRGGGSEALLSLFQTKQLSCGSFARADSAWCALNQEVGGHYDAISVEDGGTHWTLAEARAVKLFDAILAAGTPEAVLATRDRRTPEGSGGIYYMAFSVPSFDASDPAFNYASDTVGNGFGLKMQAGAAEPILEFSLLSEDWNPLKWVQNNGAPHHVLIFPENTDGYPAMFDGMEDDFYGR
jgi:hypothetical protein